MTGGLDLAYRLVLIAGVGVMLEPARFGTKEGNYGD
jgi:hypothetical protein